MVNNEHINQTKERDKVAYNLGREFLLGLLKDKGKIQNPKEVLLKYLKPKQTENLNDIYMRILVSSKNRRNMKTYINSIVGDISKLEDVLSNFVPREIRRRYFLPEGWKIVSNDILKHLQRKEPENMKSGSYWCIFCKSVVSGAIFLSHFDTKREFDDLVEKYYDDQDERVLLASFLGDEIKGFGFALACDFLKEIGYEKFGKPDTVLKNSFINLSLSINDDDITILNSIDRMATNLNTTSYSVDKIFWLIGSGNFYLDELKLGRNLPKFIEYAKKTRQDLFGKH